MRVGPAACRYDTASTDSHEWNWLWAPPSRDPPWTVHGTVGARQAGQHLRAPTSTREQVGFSGGQRPSIWVPRHPPLLILLLPPVKSLAVSFHTLPSPRRAPQRTTKTRAASVLRPDTDCLSALRLDIERLGPEPPIVGERTPREVLSRAERPGREGHRLMRHSRAGTPATPADLVDIPRLVTAYYSEHPDPSVASERVAFGTSGHRGSSLTSSFNDDHIAAITQAICDYRADAGIGGPLFLGRDTHGLSAPAWVTAIEVLVANGVAVRVDSRDGYTPTPALSHAILTYNRDRATGRSPADGIVVTPSHNPPTDGGFKYNPPHGGPAETAVTKVIEDRANEILADRLRGVRRLPLGRARLADTFGTYDFLDAYVSDLPSVLELDAVRAADLRVGADPLGGASVAYWEEIADRFGLQLSVVNREVDPTWRFMPLDWDGKIRTDCSSPDAMARLIERRGEFALATGNDADADRHGIVTPDGGLMNPNHFLAVAIDYLFTHRPGWPVDAAVGKTLVSSSLIDRVAAALGRRLLEVPVGFKWFVDGLRSGQVGFGGEESAGAVFLRRDGTVWTTDKDGILLCLLASEITAVTGESPSTIYRSLTARFGDPAYARIDAPATREEKAILARLQPEDVPTTTLAGEPITATLTVAPGNGAPLGGIKVVTASGWFAARPSGTEDVYKVYAESFRGSDHLATIQLEAQEIVTAALGRAKRDHPAKA